MFIKVEIYRIKRNKNLFLFINFISFSTFICIILYLPRRRVQKVVLPSKCTEGTLDWHYPEGTLKVVVPKENGKFTFCVGYNHNPSVKKALITTRSGSREINLPSKIGMMVKQTFFIVILHNVSSEVFYVNF